MEGGLVLSSLKEVTNDDLTFLPINDGKEYAVRGLNKNLTEAVIPVTYQDLPVTEIAANGFMACSSLKKIIIPASIKKIGSAAFFEQ